MRRWLGNALLVMGFVCFGLVPARAAVVHPEDCPSGVSGCPCNGTDTNDDTACWQWAIDQARPTGGSIQYGTVEAAPAAHYYISDTLFLDSVFGGTIDGHNAMLEWTGSGADRPMWHFADTQSLTLRDMEILSDWPHRLLAAVQFTNSSSTFVAPSRNVLDGILAFSYTPACGTGCSTCYDALHYGVMFTVDSIDAMNDQSYIVNSGFEGVSNAAISIEGQNSLQHKFFNVSGSGVLGNQNCVTDDLHYTGTDPSDPAHLDCGAAIDTETGVPIKGASFIRSMYGSFTYDTGFAWNFKNAVFFLAHGDPVEIIDSESEESARFITTQDGYSSYPSPQVSVHGGTFAVNSLATDGKMVNWNRYGTLTIEGMLVKGDVPSGSRNPYICYAPAPSGTAPPGKGQLEVSHIADVVADSATWDLIQTNSNASVLATGNLCFSAVSGTQYASSCTGLGGGFNDHPMVLKNQDLTDGSNVFPTSLATLNGSQTLVNKNLTSGTNTFPTSLATLTGSQTLTNKNLTSGTNSFPTSLATLTGSQTLTNKDLTSGTNSFPSALATLTGSQTLTNKDLTSGTNSFPSTLATTTTTQTLSSKTLTSADLTATSNTYPQTGLLVFSAGGSTVSTTRYCAPNSSGTCDTATESKVSLAAPSRTIVKNLNCKVSAAPGSSRTWTLTLYKNGSSTSLSCSISGTSATTCSETSTAVTYSAGDTMSLQMTATTSPAPTAALVQCSLGMGP